jgi:2-keto-3-deoxy-L-rhamnonate aldolase RhmA
MRDNSVKKKLARNQLTLGTWITIGNPDVAEILAWSGFDWIIFDMEHAPLDISVVENLAQAVSAAPTLPIVRVPWNDPVYVKRALDLGVSGVMIPYVNDKQEALQAVRSAKYPPVGIRGVAPRRASLYGLDWDEYLKKANDQLLVVLQVETVEAVKNVEEILSVDGIDVVFVGPLDLSFSAGHPAKTTHPKVQDLIRKVAEAGESAGVRSGIHSSVEQIGHYADMGFKFIATGGDTDFLLGGAKEAIAAKDQALGKLQSPGKSKS